MITTEIGAELNTAKKTLVIGGNGIGKTTFIIDELIPYLDNKYLIFDILREYKSLPFGNRFFVNIKDPASFAWEIKNTILQTPDYKTLIFDNMNILAQKLDWLKEITETKSLICVFPSIQTINTMDVPDIFDTIYLFPTKDTATDREAYISRQLIKKGVYIKIIQEYKRIWSNQIEA